MKGGICLSTILSKYQMTEEDIKLNFINLIQQALLSIIILMFHYL